MPLSAPAPREPLHDRDIHCRGFRRADGLWDIEAHMQDRKHYGFDNLDRESGRIEAGEALHDMWLRLTIDDERTVMAVEASIDAGPYQACPQAIKNMQRLVGQRIKPGWNLTVRKLLGGTAGCTHLTELLAPIATVAFQTQAVLRHPADLSPGQRPYQLDACHAWASDGEMVRERYAHFYRPAKEED